MNNCDKHCDAAAAGCGHTDLEQKLTTTALRLAGANAGLRRANNEFAQSITSVTTEKVYAEHNLEVQEILTEANLRTADAERDALIAEIKCLAHKFVSANSVAKGLEDEVQQKTRDIAALKARVSLLELQRGQALTHTDGLSADLEDAQVKIEKLEAKLAKGKKKARKFDPGLDVAGA